MKWLMVGMMLSVCLAGFPAAGAEAPQAIEESLDVSRSSWIELGSFTREPGSETGCLVIRIKDETITYLDVPVSVWEDFKTSDSIGQFYGKNIKQNYERETGEPLWKAHDSPTPLPAMVRAQCAFNEECEPVILRAIEQAQTSLYVAAYAFTRSRVAGALARARRRGVEVRMKVDQKQSEYPLAVKQLAYLEHNGIPVTRIAMTGDYAAMHNKFLVIDGRFIVTGSYNYTTTAQVANWENIVWIESAEMAAAYRAAWEAIAPH